MEQAIEDYRKGFTKGLIQVRIKDKAEVVEKIRKAIGVINRVSFYSYQHGKVEPKASQAAAIEKIFAEYGITEIWGQ
ncbi:MAG: hypothetical protein LBS07_02210 [Prevotellaceae bacterium]|jgi:hypothetical protein|nr:hypothetical protein [Prevotellaceae bacterium]